MAHASSPDVVFADGTRVPALGVGTWRMGEDAAEHAREVAAVRAAIDLGMTVVDTAEMYGEGGAEEVVADAIQGRRDGVFLVSKVYPHNASAKGVVAACERSLARLRTDRLDLYLLHWRGRYPLADTVAGFERLRAAGKIRRWGVSNFDTADMRELLALPEGRHCASNQVLYNLRERGIEFALRPLCQQHGISLMAYSPLHQGVLLRDRKLATLAARLEVTPAQLALAWVLAQDNVMAIPKSSSIERLRECRGAVELRLDRATRDALDAAYPPPSRETPLAMI